MKIPRLLTYTFRVSVEERVALDRLADLLNCSNAEAIRMLIQKALSVLNEGQKVEQDQAKGEE